MYFHQLFRLTSKFSSLLWQFLWNRECTNIFSWRTRATFHEFCRILLFFLSKEKAFSNERRFFNWLFEEKRHLRHSTRRRFLTNFRKKTTFYFSRIRSSLHQNRRKISTIETSSILFRCLDHRISFFETQILRRFQRQLFKHQVCRLNFCRRCHINHFICDQWFHKFELCYDNCSK